MKKYKLGDIADIQISSVDKKSKDGEIPVKLCNFVDVYYNYAITKQMAKNFMNATAKQKEIDIFKLQKGQVALTKDSETRDDIGVPTYIADTFENVILGYHTALVTPNQEILNGKYLNAFMNTKYIQKYFENNATGSGQRYSLSNEVLANVPIIAPDLPTQKKIGRLFSNIDKKIAINNQINELLERVARAIYEYYFVQFDFPNKQGKPYKSSGGAMRFDPTLNRPIPKDFEVKNLLDIIEWTSGAQPPKSTFIYEYKEGYTRFIQNRDYQSNSHITYIKDSTKNKICNEFDIMMDKYGEAGKVRFGLSGAYNVAMSKISVKIDNTQEYVRKFLEQESIFNYLKNACIASTRASLNETHLENLYIVIPDKETLKEFEKIQKQYIKTILHIKLENQKLKNLRDFLLPLLINAQVQI